MMIAGGEAGINPPLPGLMTKRSQRMRMKFVQTARRPDAGPARPLRGGVRLLLVAAAFLLMLGLGLQVRAEEEETTLRIGVMNDLPPVSFAGRTSQSVRGLAVDMAVMLGKVLKADVAFQPGSPDELLSLLDAGKLDFICGLPRKKYDTDAYFFVDTFISLHRHLYVTNDALTVTCEQDFPGHSIAVIEGDDYIETIQSCQDCMPIIVPTHAEGLKLLQSGEVDIFAALSSETVTFLVSRNEIPGVRQVGTVLEKIPLVILINKGNVALANKLREAFAYLIDNGVHAELKDKWLGKYLTTESVWQHYGRITVYVAGGIILTMLVILIWNFLLKRQISRIQQVLQRSEEKYRKLVEASPDLIMLLDPDGNLCLANNIAQVTFKIDAEGHPGSLFDILRPEDHDGLRELLQQSVDTGYAKRDFSLVKDKKQTLDLEFIAFMATDCCLGGKLICCIARDMSERNRMENELIQVERLAVIGKLAAGVAHEINNPLGIIMANAEAIIPGDEEALPRHLQAIRRNVERAADITNGLLNLAVPKELRMQPLNLLDAVEESIAFLRPRLKGIRLELHLPAPGLQIIGDKSSLEQVLVNLILNAADSMKGQGRLTIAGNLQRDPDYPFVRFIVQDFGPGIPKENLERIFEIFFSTKSSKGFGLGLFIARRIVEKHGGIIYAESEEGRGARFVMEFPAYLPEEEAVAVGA
jgi:PAS domain S-box-containing protein